MPDEPEKEPEPPVPEQDYILALVLYGGQSTKDQQLYVCSFCFAMVLDLARKGHDKWHDMLHRLHIEGKAHA